MWPMNIFDFITQDEIDDLPDDDPQTAFTGFVRIAQGRLAERSSEIDQNDQSGWEELNEARLGFMNVVVAAAKKYQIEPFASLLVPSVKNFSSNDHKQFKTDLDHYMTQLLLDNSSRNKRDSVLITPELRTSIRTYVFHLRELIERSDEIEDTRRLVLLKRLSEFEAELEKKRLNFLAVTILAITLASAPGGLGASADIASKLLTNILRVVGEAKIVDEASKRLPSSAGQMIITGPRHGEIVQSDFGSSLQPRPRTSNDLDDDVPF